MNGGLNKLPLDNHFSLSSFLFFFLFLYRMLTLKFVSRVFSESVSATILKLSLHMDNELLYCGIDNQTHCSYSLIFVHISVF